LTYRIFVTEDVEEMLARIARTPDETSELLDLVAALDPETEDLLKTARAESFVAPDPDPAP
jgi:hypothetical protein